MRRRLVQMHIERAQRGWNGQLRKSKAQRAFLAMHKDDTVLTSFVARKTYDFVGRVRDLGFIEIEDGSRRLGWPYAWDGTRITEAGRRALQAEGGAE